MKTLLKDKILRPGTAEKWKTYAVLLDCPSRKNSLLFRDLIIASLGGDTRDSKAPKGKFEVITRSKLEDMAHAKNDNSPNGIFNALEQYLEEQKKIGMSKSKTYQVQLQDVYTEGDEDEKKSIPSVEHLKALQPDDENYVSAEAIKYAELAAEFNLEQDCTEGAPDRIYLLIDIPR